MLFAGPRIPAVPERFQFSIEIVPASIETIPVKVFAPASVSVPLPLFGIAPGPPLFCITPENVMHALFPPILKMCVPPPEELTRAMHDVLAGGAERGPCPRRHPANAGLGHSGMCDCIQLK